MSRAKLRRMRAYRAGRAWAQSIGGRELDLSRVVAMALQRNASRIASNVLRGNALLRRLRAGPPA